MVTPLLLLMVLGCDPSEPTQQAIAPAPEAEVESDVADETITFEEEAQEAVAEWEPAPGCGAFPPELANHPATRIELGQQNISNVIIDLGLPDSRGELANEEETPTATWTIVDEGGTSSFSVNEGRDGWINGIVLYYPLADDGVTALESTCSWLRE